MAFRPVVGLAIALFTGFAAQAWGQTGEETDLRRPFQGLFGADIATPRSRGLDLTFSLSGAYDHNVLDADNEPADPQFFQKDAFGLGYVGLLLWRNSPSFSFSAGGRAGVRYVPYSSHYSTASYRGFGTMFGNLGPRTRIAVQQAVSYSPYYHLTTLPYGFEGSFGSQGGGGALGPWVGGGLSFVDDDNLAALDQRVFRSATELVFARDLSRRSSLMLQYSFRPSWFPNDDRFLQRHLGRIRYVYSLNQYTRLHAGYGYRSADYDLGAQNDPFEAHEIDLGFDFARALSLTRRTTLAFGTGSLLMMQNQSAPGRGALFRFLGNAQLAHQMGRSWIASLEYQRGLRFIDGFSEPHFVDLFRGSLDGYLNRRLQFNAIAGYSVGSLEFSSTGRAYENVVAGARLQEALNRHFALFTEYFYYRHTFQQGVEIPTGFPPVLDRQGVRIGITGWIPLMQ